MTSDLQNQDNQEQQANEQSTPEQTASSNQEEPQTTPQETTTPEAGTPAEKPQDTPVEEPAAAPAEEAAAPEQPAETPAEEAPAATEPAATPEPAPASEDTAAEAPAPPAEVSATAEEQKDQQLVTASEEAAPAPEVPAAPETPAAEPAAAAPATGEAKPEGTEAPAEGEEAKAEEPPRMSDEEAQPIWDELTKALEDTALITVTCERSISGGAIVTYKGIEGFVPKSQFSEKKNISQSEIDSQKGVDMEVMVIELSGFEKRRFVASRKKAMKEKRYSELNVNDVIEGTVTSLTDYGAFVSLGGGIDGLIHISRMSKAHVEKPSDMLSVNETVKVRIVDINKEKDRVSLSMKEFTESPWSGIEDRYALGAIVKGKVRSLTDFGAYVKLDQDFSGLVHISDLSWTKRVEHPSEVVKVGEEIDVKITDINRKKRRISLSLREALDDPWPKLANIYTVGSEVQGRIKRLFEPGMIVELDQDVDCFVPRGRMGPRKPKTDEPTYKLGDTVQLKVIEIDPDKRTLVCGVPREDGGDDRGERGERGGGRGRGRGRDRDRDRGTDIPAQFKAGGEKNEDRAYSFGELADLGKLMAATGDSGTPAESTEAQATTEQPKTKETPATPETLATPETPAEPQPTPAAVQTEEAAAATEEPTVEAPASVDEAAKEEVAEAAPETTEAPAAEETPAAEEKPAEEAPAAETAPAAEETPAETPETPAETPPADEAASEEKPEDETKE